MSTLAELYSNLVNQIDLNAGFVYVSFMKQDEEDAVRVRDGRTGREYMNDDIAVDIGGSASYMLSPVKSFISNVVRNFTAHMKFIHCEVGFEPSAAGKKKNGSDKLLAVFVNSNENVEIRWRKFNQKYVWFNVRANNEQIQSMLMFACVTRGEPYSSALRNSTATMPGSENQPGWYCSKHVATMLRSLPCEMFHLNRTNTITVDELHIMIDACDHKIPTQNAKTPPIVYETMYGAEAVRNVLYAQTADTK